MVTQNHLGLTGIETAEVSSFACNKRHGLQKLKSGNLSNDIKGIFIELSLKKVKWHACFFNISSSFSI